MITEEKLNPKKQYVCITFFVDRGTIKDGVFVPGRMTVQRLKEFFGIDNVNAYNDDGYFMMTSIFNMVNDIINIKGVKLIGVSEDHECIRYHFVIE